MLKDPCLRWDGPFPYDALADVGVTPHSSMEQVRDASFELMANGTMTQEARAAWDTLRVTGSRLLVDFLLYDVDLQAAVEAARATEQCAAGNEPPLSATLADPALGDDPADALNACPEIAFLADLGHPLAPEPPATRLEP